MKVSSFLKTCFSNLAHSKVKPRSYQETQEAVILIWKFCSPGILAGYPGFSRIPGRKFRDPVLLAGNSRFSRKSTLGILMLCCSIHCFQGFRGNTCRLLQLQLVRKAKLVAFGKIYSTKSIQRPCRSFFVFFIWIDWDTSGFQQI